MPGEDWYNDNSYNYAQINAYCKTKALVVIMRCVCPVLSIRQYCFERIRQIVQCSFDAIRQS